MTDTKNKAPSFNARVTIESSVLGVWVQHVKLTVDESREGAEKAAEIAANVVKQCVKCCVVSVELENA